MSFPCVFPSAISVLPSFRGGGGQIRRPGPPTCLYLRATDRDNLALLWCGARVFRCLSCFVRETDFGDLDLLCAVKRLPSFQIRRVVSLL